MPASAVVACPPVRPLGKVAAGAGGGAVSTGLRDATVSPGLTVSTRVDGFSAAPTPSFFPLIPIWVCAEGSNSGFFSDSGASTFSRVVSLRPRVEPSLIDGRPSPDGLIPV